MIREFTLQPALAHKKKIEEVRQMELAEAELAYEHGRRVLNLLSDLERLGCEELERHQGQGQLDIGSINIYLQELQALQKKIDEQTHLLGSLNATVQQRREILVEATKEKKALEKLREKHDKEVTQALGRAENKLMEEIATSQFHRRKVGLEQLA